jgi:hypothetical protein
VLLVVWGVVLVGTSAFGVLVVLLVWGSAIGSWAWEHDMFQPYAYVAAAAGPLSICGLLYWFYWGRRDYPNLVFDRYTLPVVVVLVLIGTRTGWRQAKRSHTHTPRIECQLPPRQAVQEVVPVGAMDPDTAYESPLSRSMGRACGVGSQHLVH